MKTTSYPETPSSAWRIAAAHRISRYLGIVLLVGVIVALMHGAALAAPGWLLAVPFLLLGWVEAGEFLIADFRFLNGDSGMQNQKSGRAAAAKAAAGSVVYHAVLAAVVIVGHGQMADRSGMRQHSDGGCGCGAGGRTLASSATSGCGCGSGSGSGCGCGAGKAAAGGSQSQPATASGCGCGAKKAAAVAAKPAMPPISEAELKARSEAIQKRTMTLPPTQLPGVSVNGAPPKPLPAGIQPKASTAMPKGVTPAAAIKPGEDALNGSHTAKDMDTGKEPALPSGGPAVKRSASIAPVEAPATRPPEARPAIAEPAEGAKPGEAPNTQAPVVKP